MGLKRRRIVLAVLVALALVGFGVWYFALRGPTDDFGRFQGEWQLLVPAGADKDGTPVARPKPVMVRVTGDRWVYVVDGKEQKRYTMTLRPEANPKEIDLTQLGPDDKPTAFVIRGVYAIDGAGERAKIAHAPDPQPRPTTLDENAPDFSGQVWVWLLERVP